MNKEITLPADESYIPAVELRAGDIRALYEKGRLRYIFVGDIEIIRMIYPALRDQNWSTIIPVKNEEKISRQQRSFSISYSAVYQEGEIKYKAFYSIEGYADNTIVFRMKGEALSSFERRRIGLCLLHPIDGFSGRDIEVLQPDGTSYNASFPEYVSPFQPFLHIKGMKLVTENKVFVEIAYEGDVFETEDQRNWSDNSYKTYSTPLSLPAPAQVNKGDVVEQKITLRADPKYAVQKKTPSRQKEIRRHFPRIGYTMPKDETPLTALQVELLKNIPLDHCKVQLDLDADWKGTWKKAAGETARLNTNIELFLNFNEMNGAETDSVIHAVEPLKDRIASILILSSRHETAPKDFFEQTYAAIKSALGGVSIGYGTGGDFADLNRNRPTEIEYDFVNFHLQPQVHTIDSRSIMSNLESHGRLIESAEKFTGDKPVHVSTVNFSSGNVADKRFNTAFAAWWTLQALRNLGAASSLTFYALTGNEGLINGDKPTPVYEVLKAIKEFSPKYILQNTGNKVIIENESGERLTFSSKLPDPDSI